MAPLNWERCESWSCRSDLWRHLNPAGAGGRGFRGSHSWGWGHGPGIAFTGVLGSSGIWGKMCCKESLQSDDTRSSLQVRSLYVGTRFCPCDLHQLLCVSLKDLSKPSGFETFFFLFPVILESLSWEQVLRAGKWAVSQDTTDERVHAGNFYISVLCQTRSQRPFGLQQMVGMVLRRIKRCDCSDSTTSNCYISSYL